MGYPTVERSRTVLYPRGGEGGSIGVVGLLDYFRRRRERESAVPGLEVSAGTSEQVAPLAPSPAPGEGAAEAEADALGAAGVDLAQLGQIGVMIAQAARQGNIQVHVGEPQEINLRGGAELGEEIKDIMRRHGLDPDTQTADVDASQLPAMQREILDALTRQGIDLAPGPTDSPDL